MRLRSLVSAAVLTAASFAASGVTAASAAPCTPLTASYGGTSVTVCIGFDLPPAGYPSVGAYVNVNGYVQVCSPGCITVPVNLGTTGGAIVPGQVGITSGGAGAAIPNTCVSSICTPSALPGYKITFFGDPTLFYVWVNGTRFAFDVPPVCVSTAGTC